MPTLSPAALRGDVRRLTALVYFLTMRQGARRFLDLFRFGQGTGERLLAALVVGAVFFLVVLGAAMAAALPIGYGLGVAAGALLAAWGTSAAFVLGPPDDAVAKLAEHKRAELLDRRAELREVEAEAAELAEFEAVDRRAERAEGRDRTGPRPRPQTARCAYCGGVVAVWAAKCRHCGEFLDEGLRQERLVERTGRRKSFYPLAALLSWVWPGLGQIIKGQVGRGLMFMMAEFAGYMCCLVPGVVIHVINIFDAAVYND